MMKASMQFYMTIKKMACVLAIMLCVTSCSKNIEAVLPEDTTDAALNFYLGSEVMQQAYSPSRGFVAIHVDQYTEFSKSQLENRQTFATIPIGYTDSPEYPTHVLGEIVPFMRYRSGSHRIYFTDITNTVVLDTTVMPVAESYNCIYFVDKLTANGTAAQYGLLMVQEDRTVTAGKTGVRFVHMSADAGKITCKLRETSGNISELATLNFGDASPYQYFDSNQLVDGLYRFTLITEDGHELSAGAPNKPDRNYVVMITGFKNAQQRQVAFEKLTDGSIRYETVTINAGLKTELRSTY